MHHANMEKWYVIFFNIDNESTKSTFRNGTVNGNLGTIQL